MAKKKRNNSRKQRTPTLAVLSAEELREKGDHFLQQEKYQDAIRYFKQLLKLEKNTETLRVLEQAYIGRIQSLAAKSMIKEAKALLETMIQRCPEARVDSLKLSLLLQAGNFTEGACLYTQRGHHWERDQVQRFEPLFGALLLAGIGLQPADFAEDSPITRHYPLALEALDLFCAKEESKTQDVLKQIPFRSPYRDLRILLTGLLQFYKDKEKGAALLRKIEKESPYYHYAGRYLAAGDTPGNFLRNLAATPKRDHQQVRDQYGLSVLQFLALLDLSQTDGKPFGLYKIVRRHSGCFDAKQRIELLKNIVPFARDKFFDVLPQCSEFDMLEKYRIGALAAEKDGAFPFAVEFWSDYLGESKKQAPVRHKEVALILRHQVKLMQQAPYEFSPQDVLDTMLKSLEFDHTNARTWLDAAEHAGHYLSLPQHYAIINDAVQKLPENVTILVAAMKASGKRGAHKKASSLAKRILELDPINISALDFLVESRLEHGRKLAFQKKWLLAEKELQSADTRVKAVRFKGRNLICLGMLLLLQNKEEGLQPIGAGKQENGSSLLSHVLTSLESRLYQLPSMRRKAFDRELIEFSAVTEVIDRAEFLRLITWILSFDGKQWQMFKEVCQGLKKYFSRAATLDWSRDEGVSICKALDRADLTIALKKCSGTLQEKFPDDLEIEVWYMVAKYGKANKPLSEAIVDTLEDLMEELARKNRFELAERIQDILRRNRQLSFASSFYNDDDDFFDDGPFKMPQKTQPPKKTEPKVKPFGGKQLNLFDDIQ